MIMMLDTPMFGVHYPPEGKDWNHMKDVVHMVEDNGYDLFTVTDHFMNMADPEGDSNHPLEAWTLLAALGAETDRIRLGPLVSCYAYRRPTVLAKMATTVDVISGGRLIFGIGAGWHEAEFKGFMGAYPKPSVRLKRLEETVEIVKGMFSNESFSFDGRYYKVHDVLNSPQPAQNEIPIMVGGGGEKKTLRIAAKYADISHFFVSDADSLRHKLDVLRRHCRRERTEFDRIIKATTFRVALGSESEINEKVKRKAEESNQSTEAVRTRLGPLSGESDEVADRLKEFFDNGLGLVTLSFLDLVDVPLFAEEVISEFR
jgi:F420-dependent oxidoreductase-like protein